MSLCVERFIAVMFATRFVPLSLAQHGYLGLEFVYDH